ncbi:unnamed protein product [Medioppia subpectinata]|uniref:F-box domain-containing protein n=1 Tax=Medioppia subpectinata TaxID=1979941 RepID=A0A7R9Q4A1_9ACAR|nr:unnamed protein product [Medioppia subpectinata]CAG2112072.1 unnamed protein product [Medioppia subpectinata]
MTQQMKHKKILTITIDDSEDEVEDNVRQQTQMYAKNSMDRFGDDLCQLLLSYLLLEDRFRNECVSKQFQRTVFESVVDITLNEKLIRKAKQQKETLSQVLATIATNNQLFSTFGRLVTRIYCMSSLVKHSLSYCHRLSQLRAEQLSDVFDNTSGQLLVTNLKRFTIIYYSSESKGQLSEFVAQNQSLKSLVVIKPSKNAKNNQNLPEIYNQLSRLPQLRDLTLDLYLHNILLNDILRIIGLNCKQLQRLALILRPTYFKLNQTLDSLRLFCRLKRLHLAISRSVVSRQLLEPLKLCHRLTHLTLDIDEMSDKLLTDCDKHLPRLQYLSIKTNAITREDLDHISSLPALQMLVIENCSKSDDLSDNDFNYLLSRSLKLKNIEVIEQKVSKFYCRKNGQRIYSKNSMDRFSNNLCALLLSYLSLKERFVFQCVSKRFQRTVFRSVVDIDIDDELIRRVNKFKIPLFIIMNIICEKCPNIESIDFRSVGYSNQHILELFPTFRHKFPNLREIYCELLSNSDRWIQLLAPLITRISGELSSKKPSLIFCRRLSRLVAYHMSDVFSGRTTGFWPELLSIFVAQNQCLKCLNLFYITYKTKEDLRELCEQLSRLTQLRELSLKLVLIDGMNSLLPALKTLVIENQLSDSLRDNDLIVLLSSSPKLKTMEIRVNNEKKFYSKVKM